MEDKSDRVGNIVGFLTHGTGSPHALSPVDGFSLVSHEFPPPPEALSLSENGGATAPQQFGVDKEPTRQENVAQNPAVGIESGAIVFNADLLVKDQVTVGILGLIAETVGGCLVVSHFRSVDAQVPEPVPRVQQDGVAIEYRNDPSLGWQGVTRAGATQ